MALDPKNIIIDPDQEAYQPNLIEYALAAQLGKNPFAQGHYVGAGLRNRAQMDRYSQAVAQNNPLRAQIARNIMGNDLLMKRTENIDKISDVLGAFGAAGAAGLQPTGFSLSQVPIQLFQAQADAQKTASQAANEGRQAGQVPVQSEMQQDISGFDVRDSLPTTVEAAEARAKQPTVTMFDAQGNQFNVPIDYSQLPYPFSEQFGQGSTGPQVQGFQGNPLNPSQTQEPQQGPAQTQAPIDGTAAHPQDAAQAHAQSQIQRSAAINGWQLTEPPRNVTLRDGTPAIRYMYTQPDGQVQEFYAVPGNPTPLKALNR